MTTAAHEIPKFWKLIDPIASNADDTHIIVSNSENEVIYEGEIGHAPYVPLAKLVVTCIKPRIEDDGWVNYWTIKVI